MVSVSTTPGAPLWVHWAISFRQRFARATPCMTATMPSRPSGLASEPVATEDHEVHCHLPLHSQALMDPPGPPRPAPMFELIPYEKFRDTPAVRFYDITVPTSNARDLVVHSGPAVSPPDDPASGAWQFYLHPHQEDNLLALHGGRTFYLVNLGWNYPFHIVRLESGGDILRIPPGTFHRSVSDPDGSLVLNQAVRDEGASVLREFRVYNSSRIPRLFAVTSRTAPLPKLHGVSW